MHIVIATAGALSPEPVADFVERLARPRDEVSVITVIEVPRSFLDAVRSEEWRPFSETAPSWPEEEDAQIARYVEERGRKLTNPLLAALRSRNIEPNTQYFEGEDKAQTIIDAAEKLDAGLVILGATRQIFRESAWESISARVMREARRPVMVVPPPPGEITAEHFLELPPT